jgi:lipopolysaccharide export system protein LptC
VITLRGTLALAGLGAAAAFTAWVLQIGAPRNVQAAAPRHLPDYHFTAPRITRFGADGLLTLDLRAARALHFEDDDSVELEALSVDYRTDTGELWRLTAARGTAPMDGEVLTLEGAVRVSRPRAAGGGLELDTERLVLATRGQRLTTDAPVALREGGSHMTAIGLDADLRAERIRFPKQVRGTYALR